MIDLYKPAENLKINDFVYKTKLPGLFYIARRKFDDKRGFFREVVDIKELEKITGEKFVVAQMNHSRSETNVARGMHAEGWNKLVTVTGGIAFSAIADIRPQSDSFGKIEKFRLGIGQDALPGALYVSKGLANSICALEGPVDYVYIVDRLYADRDPSDDGAISVFDKDLNIDWPIKKEDMILSERDLQAVSLRELHPGKFK